MGSYLLILLNILLDAALVVLMHYQQRRTSLANLTELHRENSDPGRNSHNLTSLKIKKRLFWALKAILVMRLILLTLTLLYMKVGFVSKTIDVLGSLSWLYVYKLIFDFIMRLNGNAKPGAYSEQKMYVAILGLLGVIALVLAYYVYRDRLSVYDGVNAFIGFAFGLSSLLLLLNAAQALTSIEFYTPHTQKLKKKVS